MNYKQASDNELLFCCYHDDIKAYNELVDRYAPRLHKAGLRYLRDKFVVEELVMDLLFNIWERRHEIKIEYSFSAYLFKAFRNKLIGQLRKNIPHTKPIDEITENEIPLSGKTADANLLLEQAELLYHQNLARLSPQRRLVFELSREENLSYKAIAERTGLSLNTVENYMVAALATLRKNLHNTTTHICITLMFVLPQ
ncbi:sigma-70 family RNA polymerase sigma factor [Pseudoflavitalea sp. G-6-1-2]|uniref:sigma-70 family RNA polymerase sigma factor n=1 Tax=Pseudoflavitalea sp. G-6-1-2 TaxID=2728841 RepID=UPI00146D0F0B|nr:sigma-70 family RNA polymerase sigma factor [Pseudoflavitalea sp. G-6-1-2]NML23185.1 sigma-70 family RNA polymerase sigma factor [Pseudoflavitalea sp. G-6-1-2]